MYIVYKSWIKFCLVLFCYKEMLKHWDMFIIYKRLLQSAQSDLDLHGPQTSVLSSQQVNFPKLYSQ